MTASLAVSSVSGGQMVDGAEPTRRSVAPHVTECKTRAPATLATSVKLCEICIQVSDNSARQRRERRRRFFESVIGQPTNVSPVKPHHEDVSAP
jgi:hypothetical protein